MLKGRFNLRRLVALGLASKRKLTTLTYLHVHQLAQLASTRLFWNTSAFFVLQNTYKWRAKTKRRCPCQEESKRGHFSKRSQNQTLGVFSGEWTAVQRTKSTWSKLSGTRAIAVTDAVWRWVCARLHKSALTWLPLNKHTATWECGVQIVFFGGRVCLSPYALLAKVC